MWTFRIIFFFSIIFLIPSCLVDPCDDKFCVHGRCDDGTCICRSGYSGENCENVDGWNCVNDYCQFVQVPFPTYETAEICQNNCGSNPGNNTSGYNCTNSSCISVSSGAQYSSLSICQNSCGANEGQIVIWSIDPEPCPSGAGSTVSVYINNSYIGSLTQYFTSGTADCGDSGTITRTLPVGDYTFYADCGTNSWGPRTIGITKNGCSSWRLE